MNYFVYQDDQVYGPYTPQDLMSFVTPDTLVCLEGAEEWQRAGDVPELAPFLPAPAETETAAAPAAVEEVAPAPAPEVPAAAPVFAPGPAPAAAPPARRPPPGLPPKLQELWHICANSPLELLQAQKQQHWAEYFPTEQEVIAAELARRGKI